MINYSSLHSLIDFNNQVINLDQPKNPTLSTMIVSSPNDQSIPIQSSSEPENINEKPPEPQSQTMSNIILPTLQSQLISNEKKQEIASNLIDSVGLSVQKTWIDKMLCCLNFLRKYFSITSLEVRQRLVQSFIPFNSGFYEICVNKPDLYGPFWIYTTLVFVIAACGSLSSYFQNQIDQNFYQQFVPIAGTTVYSIGFGLPLLLYILLKFFGEKISYFSTVCIYGYSLCVFIPVTIICSCGNVYVQWIFLSYGVLASTSFILFNFWKIFSIQTGNKKYILIGIVIIVQVVLFLLLKLYFFETFKININGGNVPNSQPNAPTPTPSENPNP